MYKKVIAAVIALSLCLAAAYGYVQKPKKYTVAQDGSGDFLTIQEGVDKANDKDTLIINEGTYYECVEVFDKELNLIGTDKDKCIIQFNNSHYWKVPLTISAGSVKNLTIYGSRSGEEPQPLSEEEILEIYANFTNWENVKDTSGYAVHIDQDYLYGRELQFENCKIISESNMCAGIGGRGESRIIFENCEFEARGEGGCIFLHDAAQEYVSGKMDFVLKNCHIKSLNNQNCLSFFSLLPNNKVYFTFQNVIVDEKSYDQIFIENYYESEKNDGWCGLNNAYLTDDSYGNSISDMNSSADDKK